MNMKKLLCGALSGLIMSAAGTVSAYGQFWYDMHTDLPMWKKAVIFPLSNAWEPNKFLISYDEQSDLYWMNKYLMERFEKKIKNMHTIRLAPGIKEKNDILIDKYSMLLAPFESEKARAEAVFENTGADMYIIPQFTKDYVYRDVSPSISANVELKSWTEEINGPNGNRKYNETKRTVHHVMPAREVQNRVVELSYTGYDTKANKVMLFSDIRYDAGYDNKHNFRDISKYLRKEFSEIKSGAREKKNAAGVVTVGFKNIAMPANRNVDRYSTGNTYYNSREAACAAVNHYKNGSVRVDTACDELMIKSAYYAIKVEAIETLKGVHVLIDESADVQPDYYITGNITDWITRWNWIAPSISTKSKLLKSEESKWTDKDGKEHKMTTQHWTEEVKENYGHWTVKPAAGLFLALVDAKTGKTILSSVEGESNDKIMDAHRECLEKFYKQVNEYFKERGVK